MDPASSPPRTSTKGKERGRPGMDLADRMVAFQRRNAASSTTRPKADRPSAAPVASSSSMKPTVSGSRAAKPAAAVAAASAAAASSTDAEEHFRRLRISPLTNGKQAHPPSAGATTTASRGRLYVPEPTRREEAHSDAGSSSYAARPLPVPRQLFDPRRDDPVRFAVLTRPTPSKQQSIDYVSASSTSMSSYASSAFTLTSNTTSSSSSAPPDHGLAKEEGGSNVFILQLKKVYREISTIEGKLLAEDNDDDQDVVVVKARANQPSATTTSPVEQDKWLKLIADHKSLAEACHNLLTLTMLPHVPTSMHNIPTKYNIPTRLWSHAFHRLLETLRRASTRSVIALEHLTDFIYYAYTFYTTLHEERYLDDYKGAWIEALGDLARFKMLVATMVAPPSSLSVSTSNPITSLPASTPARIDDSPVPSIGPTALESLEIETEREIWRCTSRGWYAAGLMDTPGTGKLHHHLGLLSREAEGEELRGVYHFVKSLITSHPFLTSRENILPLFSSAAQSRRSLADAKTPDLFVLLHGMIFTHIQLDDFQPTLARFLERLELEGAEEKEWIMMGIVNIAALFEYGKPSGVLRAAIGAKEAPKRKSADVEDKKMDLDEADDVSEESNSPSPDQLPIAFRHAMQLAFATLSFTLRHPFRRATPFSKRTLNPYNTVLLTFLATALKQPQVLGLLERSIPWEDLAVFFASVPRHVWGDIDPGAVKLTAGCAPLPEDWCLRGMEWVRRVYERGFWKTGNNISGEMDVLLPQEGGADTDGIIEDDDDQPMEIAQDVPTQRWVRVARASGALGRSVKGFQWDKDNRKWVIGQELLAKVRAWEEEERAEREAEERRRTRTWDRMEIDSDEEQVDEEESESDSDGDSEEVKALKARRRYLRSLVQSSQSVSSSSARNRPRPRHGARPHAITFVPGYTVLVVDTNILLSSLKEFSALVESLRWTIVVPLAVITELDGLSSNSSPLGAAASAATSYLTANLRSHSTSLKVQTSKGNYLSTLTIRCEQVNLNEESSWERNMDDLILRAAVWQDEHWVDRSQILLRSPVEQVASTTSKVVLLTLDRNLRLKARARQLDAADEKDMAQILAAR